MADTACKKCGLPIVFITTPSGSAMPCDPKRISVVTEEGRIVQGLAPHWAVCPSGHLLRKPKVKDTEMSKGAAKKALRKLREQLDGLAAPARQGGTPEEEI